MSDKIDIWGPDGVFGRSFPGFTPRREQQRMYRAVAEALVKGQNALIEGGTGTGKGLAYLTPLILLAYRRQDVKAGVSASTINLQEQLVNKDIPQAVKALEMAGLIEPGTFRFTTLKGKNNYLCEENRAILEDEATGRWPDAERALRKVEEWDTYTGDRAELQLTQSEIHPWALMSCQYSKTCEAYNSGSTNCNVNRARAKAAEAHLVVINHAVLLADMSANDPHLGQLTHLVLDEGHHLEEEASKQFGTQTSRREYLRTLDEITNDPLLAERADETKERWRDAWDALTEWMRPEKPRKLEAKTVKPTTREGDEWVRAAKRGEAFTSAAANLASAMTNEAKRARSSGDTRREGKLRRILDETNDVRTQMEQTFAAHDPETVRWVEPRDDHAETITSIPLRVGPILRDKLFDRKASVIVTSATLTTERGNFDMMADQIGASNATTLAIDSPFNYRAQALAVVPTNMPNPRQWKEYEEATALAIQDICLALGGHTLALFTSNAAIKATTERIKDRLEREGIATLAQNLDGSAADLLRMYRDDTRAVILGTNSFWEGVDLADEGMLQSVVVCKLPFPVPSDPIIEARGNLYDDPFTGYQVPLAVMRFKQGIGRLVRNDKSHGTIVILDPRFDHRKYGEKFQRAMPDCDYRDCKRQELGKVAREWQESR